jgi:disulfide oxidoreductase YuzD
MPKIPTILWLDEPEEHNYPAAASYLALILDDKETESLVKRLRKAPMTVFKAKDIFRASGLPLLGVSNVQIEKNLEKINDGKAISPLLLVRDAAHGKVVIADGYHRLCAVYSLHQDTPIPCKIA